MNKQDYEDTFILKDAVITITDKLKEITNDDIYSFRDSLNLLQECDTKLLRIAYLANKLYSRDHLMFEDGQSP